MDPGTFAYGLYPRSPAPYNLKKIKRESRRLSLSSPVEVRVERKDDRVYFKSEQFHYYQEHLPKDIDFCIGVQMVEAPQELEIEFIKIW